MAAPSLPPSGHVFRVERPRFRISTDFDAFSPEEVWALVRAAASKQDAGLYLTAAFTGLRMGELLALEWHDIDYAGDVIRVRRSYNLHDGVGSPKSGRSVRSRWFPTSHSDSQRPRGARTSPNPRTSSSPGDTGRWQDASSLRIRYEQALERGLRRLRRK